MTHLEISPLLAQTIVQLAQVSFLEMAVPPDAAALAAAQEALRDFTIEAFTLFSIGCLVTILRTYARIKAVGVKHLQPDDYLVWIGVVSYPRVYSRP